jgi:hypothetical protein
MTREMLLAGALLAAFALPAPASAKCADEIKALEQKAKASDDRSNVGSQAETSSPGTVPKQGGGEPSASAKVLEAQAHAQKGDEAACMKALEEAKATMK